MAQLPITRQRWTPPAARVEGDRLLKARAVQQRMIDAAIQAKAEAKAVEVQAEKQLAEKVDELDKDLDRLIDNIPKIIPSGGGGRRMVKKILANEYDLPSGLGSAAGNDTEDFATAVQGGKADTAVQPDDLASVATSGSQDDMSDGITNKNYTATEQTKLAAAVVKSDTSVSGFSFTVDEDDMASDSATLLPTQQSVKANIDLYAVRSVADRTALAASPATIIFNRDAADEKIWIKTSDDISAEITAGDPRYLPTSGDATGASGGFYQAGSVGKGNPWVNVAGGADIRRIGDRLMVGCDAAPYDGKTLGATDDTKSWILATHIDYLLPGAAFAAVTSNYTDGNTPSSGSIAVTGAARHNGSTGGGAIGGGFASWNDGYTTSAKGWGIYAEAVRAVSTAGFTHAAELDITLLAVSPRGATAGTTPYHPFTAGSSHGLWIGCGGGANLVGNTVYNSDAAIGIISNGAFHNAGIVIFDGALYRDGGVSTGRGHAMRLAANYAIEQYAAATDVLAASIAMNVSDATHRQELRIDDNGLTQFNADGKRMFRALWATSAVNGIELVSAATGGTVIVRPTSSDDTDVAIAFRPMGAANGFLQNGTGSLTAMRWNGTGIGFYGASPSAKPTITGSRGSNAALADLLTKMATLGILTDSTS